MAILPGNYNAVTIQVDPGQVRDASVNIETLVIDIANELTSISDALKALQVGWDGSSAAEAKDFSDQWMAAMTQLFGSGETSSPGLLDEVHAGLLVAARNYSAADTAIAAMFASLGSQLSSTSQGGTGGPIPPGATITDGSLSAVGEFDWTVAPGI